MKPLIVALCIAFGGCFGGKRPRFLVTAPVPFIAPAPTKLTPPKLPAFRFDPDLRPENRTLFTPEDKPIYPMIVNRWD